jgi:hypothetical protein
MKTGDLDLISMKSHKALEVILDNLDAQPDSDTAHPQFAAELETLDEIFFGRAG